MKTKFYRCNRCGNLILMVHDSRVNPVCCGEKMEELKAGTVDASVEKHVPAVSVEGNKVKVAVGDVIHPMVKAHYIQWIYLQTKSGGQLKYLQPNQEPTAEFLLDNDEAVAVFEYCNLHGLWKRNI